MKHNIKKAFVVLLAALLCLATVAALVACDDNKGNTKGGVRIVMPDGTPALSMAKLFSENKTIAGRSADYQIVAADALMTEMGTGSADVLVMPTNAGINGIVAKGFDYKLVSVNVLGSLYIVGPDADGEITFDDLKGKKLGSIGKNNTPDWVFGKIVEGKGLTYSDYNVTFYNEAPMVKQAITKGEIDFALVGEPAATAFSAGQTGWERMNLQTYWKEVTGQDNYPQASMFVKSSLCNDGEFMSALLAAVRSNAEWLVENKTEVTDYLKTYGSTSSFPAASIERCAVTMLRAKDNAAMIKEYMSVITGTEWNRTDVLY